MIFVNAETNSKIHIGRAGEHKTTTVVFDISDWIEEVRNEIDPDLGTVELIVEQNSMSYPQLIEYNREEKKVYWVVTHSNTSEPGIGKCELFYLGKEELTRLFKKPDNWETEYTEYYDAEGNKLVESSPHEWNDDWKNYSDSIPYFYMARPTLKTALYEIIVTNALGYNEEEPPGPYESWVDDVLNASTDIKQAGDEAIVARDEVIVARNETVTARNEAIAARDEAVEAQRGANAAIGEVINAKNDAVIAKNEAVEAQELAVNAKNEAETIKNAVIEAKNTAETAAQEALERKNEAVSAKNEAVKAQGLTKTAQDAAEDAQSKAEGAKSAAETAQLKAVEAQGLAEEARDEAKRYIGNPPIPDENTKTWWVYDPEVPTANEDGYVNTNMPYNFHIDYIVQNQTKLAEITDMKMGDMAAIQAAVSDPMNAQLYIYTGNGSINGWEFLLDLSGATGNGISSISKTSSTINEQGNVVDTYTITYTLSDPTTFTVINGKDGADGIGSGDMLKKDYDSDEVVKTAGGIVKYVESKVKEGGTYYTAGEVDGLLQNKADTSSVYTKTESDTLLQKKVNPNLLDNWYFGNAVNQRGATGSITINRYFIDRWLYANGDSASSLTFSDGVVALNGTNGYCALRQIFETPKSVFIGKAMTISALTTELGLVSHTFTCLDGVENYKNFSDTGSYIVFDTRADNVLFTFVANMETLSIIACKVEFGDHQTLAHQENGVWVLNEIPDYGEQLARCQRYFYRIEDLYTTGVYEQMGGNHLAVQTIYFPVTMRTEPSFTFEKVYYRNGGSWTALTSTSRYGVDSKKQYSVPSFDVDNLTSQYSYVMRLLNIQFSADLL